MSRVQLSICNNNRLHVALKQADVLCKFGICNNNRLNVALMQMDVSCKIEYM